MFLVKCWILLLRERERRKNNNLNFTTSSFKYLLIPLYTVYIEDSNQVQLMKRGGVYSTPPFPWKSFSLIIKIVFSVVKGFDCEDLIWIVYFLVGFPFFRKKISILEMEWSGNLLRKPEFRDNSGINGNRKFSVLQNGNRKISSFHFVNRKNIINYDVKKALLIKAF